MQLIDRSTNKIIRSLDTTIKPLLIDHFVKKIDIGEAKQFINSLLKECYQFGYRLTCDCLNAVDSKPMFAIRSDSFKNTFSIVRMTHETRPKHHETCELKSLFKEKTNKSYVTFRLWNKNKPLNLLKNYKLSLTKNTKYKKKEKSSIAKHEKAPKIARVLYNLIIDAGLHRVKKNMLSINEQYALLKSATKDYKITKNISLKDFFFTFAEKDLVENVAKKLRPSKWPKLIQPYAMVLLVIDKYDDKKVYCSRADSQFEFELKGNLKVSSGRIQQGSHPFLLFANISSLPDDSTSYAFLNGFIVPVYSKRLLLPVESNFERQVLKKLIESFNTFNIDGNQLTIEKPLFDIIIESKEAEKDLCCRPDFILTCNGKKAILEVMGSIEIEYLESKKRTHEIMTELGKLFVFDAVSAERKNLWNVYLSELITNLHEFFYHA